MVGWGWSLSLNLDRLSLRGWLKCNRQVGKAGMDPGRRDLDKEKTFLPSPSMSSFLAPPPLPRSGPYHLTSAPSL